MIYIEFSIGMMNIFYNALATRNQDDVRTALDSIIHGDIIVNALPLTPVLLEFLDGIIPGPLLDAGTQGTIYELTNTTILKRTCYDEDYVDNPTFRRGDVATIAEVELGTRAGELGVGPRIHRSMVILGDIPEDDAIYIIMDRLSGPTLEVMYPPTPEMLVAILNLFLVLIENGIDQHDATLSNLMFDQGRLYVIDYGRAEPLRQNGADYFSRFIEVKIRAITVLSDQPQWNADTFHNRACIFVDLMEAGQAWLDQHFPGTLIGSRFLKVDEETFGDCVNEIKTRLYSRC